ncbi:hypothetical protein DXG01_008733 [Tephrocybe rancida]|nr:hypothetical protein DXG01_008733 [Tephrocybe rancida]
MDLCGLVLNNVTATKPYVNGWQMRVISPEHRLQTWHLPWNHRDRPSSILATMSEVDGRQTPTPLVDTVLNALAPRAPVSATSLKRRASSSFEGCEGDTSRKRIKEDQEATQEDVDGSDVALAFVSPTLADDLARDLECGCCSELVYRPVLNGGTNCPACRGLSTVVTPFRALQSVIDTLLRAAPHKARTERERQQADEVYKFGHSMRIPPPREPSPDTSVEVPTDFARPCPHCTPGNAYGWRCPQPIPDPLTDIDHAWHLEDGVPPGHAHCAKTYSRHEPRIQQRSVTFVRSISVALACKTAASHCLSKRNNLTGCLMGFKPLMELELFSDIHGVAPGIDPDPEAPRAYTCRHCATEVFLWGLREWWVRERQKGFLEETAMSRKDCPDGRMCMRQTEHSHAKEFNHIFSTSGPEQPVPQPEQAVVEPEQSLAQPDHQALAPELSVAAPTGQVTPALSLHDVTEPPEVPPSALLWDLFSREVAHTQAEAFSSELA